MTIIVLIGGLLVGVGVTPRISGGRSASPQLVWSANRRVDQSPSSCSEATIAADSAGGRYAIWTDERGGNGDVFFNQAPPGESWGSEENVIIDSTYMPQRAPDIASDAAGNTYAVWADYRRGHWDVYFAFRPAGGVWGPNAQVNDDPATGHQSSPRIAIDAAGNACVVWEDARNDTGIGNRDIYADCRSPGGTWGEDRKVNDDLGTALQRLPALAVSNGGQFCAAWWDQRRSYQDTYFACREVNGTWGVNERVNDVSKGHYSESERGPALVIDGIGTAYVLWEDYRAGNWDIYFAYRPLSGLWQGHRKINDDLISNQSAPAISVSPGGDLTAVWQDMRNGNGDIYSDYRPAGGDWGIDTLVNDDTDSSSQEYPDVITDATGRSHAVWEDHRNGIPHIYSASTLASTAKCFVSSTADSGPGSLRSCLTAPEADHTISFDLSVFSPDMPATITLASALPAITTDGLNIDASNAAVILDGHLLTGSANGLSIEGAANVVVRGLQIIGFPGNGIALRNGASSAVIGGTTPGWLNVISGNGAQGILITGWNTTGNQIVANRIGTDAVGEVAFANKQHGVLIEQNASENIIGGPTSAHGNVISANLEDGIRVDDSDGNIIQGNRIGTNGAGAAAVPNGGSGLYLKRGAESNSVLDNLISGNGQYGIWVRDIGTRSNVFRHNLIGSDAAGLNAVPNQRHGMLLDSGASDNQIGGSTAADRNLISGNRQAGVALRDSATTRNVIAGNIIGANISGADFVPNSLGGINIAFGPHHNTIGGEVREAGNVISGNTAAGVYIGGSGADDNIVRNNLIGTTLDGRAALPNEQSGVGITEGAKRNVIVSNVISGNAPLGIAIADAGTSLNRVTGNLIGLDITGTYAVPNQESGVNITTGASGNTVGGLSPTDRNVISGNMTVGVDLGGAGVQANQIIGNYIGVDKTGTHRVANQGDGITIHQGASHNTLKDNIISGNGSDGIGLAETGTSDNTISGNKIGTDVSGLLPLGNGQHGIYMWSGTTLSTIGPNNTIAFNRHGIYINNSQTLTHTITANSIFSNSLAGIKLDNDGNGGIASPRIITATCRHVSGNALSNAAIEIFSDAEGEGKAHEGMTLTSSEGVWEFDKPGGFELSQVTATQTDSAGNTSEFSLPYPLPACTWTYLPLVFRPEPIFEGPMEVEDNDTSADANGPIRSGRDYRGLPDDSKDYFRFDMYASGPVVVHLKNHTGRGVQLQLFYQDTTNRVCWDADPTPPYECEYFGQPGRYLIYIYTESGHNSTSEYVLRATFP